MKNIFHAFMVLVLMTSNVESSDEALIPAGEFVMGTDQSTPAERPAHKIWLDDFYLYRF